jgi:regulator of ribonuclease activity A
LTSSTADLIDEFGDRLQSVSMQFVPFGRRAFDGLVRTVKCFKDNALLKSVLSTPGDGCVLVVDGGGSLDTALMGDMIAQLAVENRWAGVIINGAIRDSVAISSMPLGVKALGTNPAKSSKTGAGELDVVLEFGGVVFRPGAHVYSDEDGIVVER